MGWLVIKRSLKTSWTWVKAYWYVPALLVYSVVLALFFRKNSGRAEEVLESSTRRYREEIETIRNSHDEEIAKRDISMKKYHDALEQIEKKYQESREELGRVKKKKLLEIVKKYQGDDAALAEKISEKFGVEYVGEKNTE